MMSIKLTDITILNIKGSNYRCIISLISKNKTINPMQNADFIKKAEHCKHTILLSHIKMGKEVLTFGDIEIKKRKFYRHKTTIFWEM